MCGPHNPAETSPVVSGESFSENIVIDTELLNWSSNRNATVVPITPAPIIATFFTELMVITSSNNPNPAQINKMTDTHDKLTISNCILLIQSLTSKSVHFIDTFYCNQSINKYEITFDR